MDLPEKCTIWNPGANDGFGGVSWDGPFVANCRIADSAQQFTDPNGDQLTSTSVLYTDSDKINTGSQVLFRQESGALIPPSESDDVRQLAQTPSATNLKKCWFA